MSRNREQTGKRGWRTMLTLIVAGAVVLGLVATLSAHHKAGHDKEPSEQAIAEIDVEWHEDDMGFNITSDKDISNVIVEDCLGVTHKHEDIDSKTFTHRENFTIAGIWVKSGANHDPDGPPGAGERFDNAGACPAEPEPEPEPCIGPHEIDGRALGNETNFVNWTAFTGADSYNLYRSVEGGPFVLLTSTDENTTQFFDDNVTDGVTYTYSATAMVDGNETESCDTVTITAIPFLPTAVAGALAAVLGVGAYALVRRRG